MLELRDNVTVNDMELLSPHMRNPDHINDIMEILHGDVVMTLCHQVFLPSQALRLMKEPALILNIELCCYLKYYKSVPNQLTSFGLF